MTKIKNELLKNRIILDEYIEQFVLKDFRNPDLDVNITLLYFEGKAMLIDTGYLFQAEVIADFLLEREIEVTEVLLTHYHPDHSAGISVFNPNKIYASEHYQDNFKRCSEEWDPKTHYVKPTHLLKDQETLFFGPHMLKIMDSKSHSIDSIMIEINDQYLLVGDLIMRDIEHTTTYPYISIDGDIQGYLHSLNLVQERSQHILLLSHGMPISDQSLFKTVVDDYLLYFKSLEAFKADREKNIPQFDWSFERWHNSNLRFLL
ncbi:MBL fold metallo-hydrolase [Fusibacter ferrireducens]|uniref:MBL fold metallo-hydrolase n=1 Tax=Fusibacter ferrireducens TaxID=2785058 RepID=A0ABR9ZPL7_9FIRM|nr:MBL fold metallo-hydrolase [Fusibacter ferrireducens]MBF4692397.1 MBL fold metallo-hydrolase [Fusibacter ferrireducens]